MESVSTLSELGAQRSATRVLSGNPRLWIFMSALGASTAIGVAVTAWYVAFARDHFGVGGVGAIATTYALVMAFFGVPAGVVVDRVAPRWVMLVAMVSMGAMALAAPLVLRPSSIVPAVALCALEAIAFSFLALAVVRSQASLVAATNRGAASLVHLAVVAAGGIAGVIAALNLTASVSGFTVLAAADLVVAVAFYASCRSISLMRRHREGLRRSLGIGELVATMRGNALLRMVVILQLCLAFVLPTQLVNLYVADYMHEELLPALGVSGFAAMAAAGAILLWRGMRPGIGRDLRTNFVAYSLVLLVAIPVVGLPLSTWRNAAVVALAGVGVFTWVIGDGLVAALVQQVCPDDIRGRVTGSISSARKLLVASGVAMATVVSDVWNTPVLLSVYLLLIVLVLIATRGFRRLWAY